MQEKLINIRTGKFSKDELKVIEDCIKEWNYDWIVEIVYVGESSSENLDVSLFLRKTI